MSMISAQIDELRKTADELDERAKAYAPTGRNVLSPMLRSAADTIWELRCKLAGVVDQSDEIERLDAENAKLRELADAVKEFVEDAHCEDCSCRRDCDDNNRIFCANDFSYHAFAAMRELGMEVDA